jgi:hypothetical protein
MDGRLKHFPQTTPVTPLQIQIKNPKHRLTCWILSTKAMQKISVGMPSSKPMRMRNCQYNNWRILLTSFNKDEDGDEFEKQRKQTEALEQDIMEVHTFLYKYLESMNFCAKSYSEIFRQQLTLSNR